MKGALAPARYELPSISCITLAMSDSLKLYEAALPIFQQSLQASLLALRHRHEVAPRSAGEELARTADLLVDVADQLVPLRNPAHRAREREDGGEHRDRDAGRLVDDARIEIHVRIE